MRISILLISMVFLNSVIAGPPPQYTRLLGSHPLTNSNGGEIGTFHVTSGTFNEEGWVTSTRQSQFLIEFDDFLPPQGAIAVTITGLMPPITDDWVPLSLYSRGDGAFKAVDESPGSYFMLKTDPHLRDSSNLDFKIFTAAFHGAASKTARQETRVPRGTWSPDVEYEFKMIWTPDQFWLLKNGEIIAEHWFQGQIETFGYLFLGKDHTYSDAMYGVLYKDLKVYIPEQTPSFRNIAHARAGLMAHRELGMQSVLVTDVNQDDCIDFYIPRFKARDLHLDNFLFQQEHLEFSQQQTQTGLDDPSYSYQALADDFDRDGDMDIFVLNFHRSDYPNNANRFFINDGAGNFTNQTEAVSLDNRKADSKGCTLVDFDADGDQDIVVANSEDEHQVYENNGGGFFTPTDLGLESFRDASRRYRGLSSADLDRDHQGELIFVLDDKIQIASRQKLTNTYQLERTLTVQNGLKSVTTADIDNDADLDLLVAMVNGVQSRIVIYQNDGGLNFSVAGNVENRLFDCYGVQCGDWDNDGDTDLYAMERNGRGWLYNNDGLGNFTAAAQTGTEVTHADGRGSATMDLNRDGRLDLITIAQGSELNVDGVGPMPYARNALFLNQTESPNRFLTVDVRNENGINQGLGYQFTVFPAHSNGTAAPLAYRQVTPVNGHKSSNSRVQHFGLGSNSAVDVLVESSAGDSFKFTHIAADQHLILHTFDIPLQAASPDSHIVLTPQDRLLAVETNPGVTGEPVTFFAVSGDSALKPQTFLTNAEGTAALVVHPAPTEEPWIYAAATRTDTVQFTFYPASALAVELAIFEAAFQQNAVHLQWRTVMEQDHLGFHVLRAVSASGPFERLNERLIPARSPRGGRYQFIDKHVEKNQTYFYKVRDVSRSGEQTDHPAVSVSTRVHTFRLAQNYPNPFNAGTCIEFETASSGHVVLKILNLQGQTLHTLVNQHITAGPHRIQFDGSDRYGRKLPSGIYLYQLQTSNAVQTKKFVIAQ